MRINVQKQMMKRLMIVMLALAACLPAASQGVRKTMDEFNKMSRNDTSLVELHGVVSKVGGNPRGILYLKDETGEAYVYGLEDGRPGTKVSFPQMGIAPGDTLTIVGRRTVYNGTTIEMAGGHLVRKADGPRHAEMLESITALDQYPTFKGKGPEAFSAWVTARLKYPKEAKAVHMDGTVTVQFVVGTNGGVQEVEVLKGIHPALDAEAVRVIRSSPQWKPGIKDGKPVRVTYTLPVILINPE